MEVTDKKRLKSGAVSLSNLPPTWQEDGFDSEEDYEKHYTKLVHSLFKQSVNEFYKEKAEWDKSEKLIQLEHIINSSIDSHPSKTRFPLLIKLIEEYVATRTADIMRPQASSRQPDMDQAVGALNYFKDVELDDNQYELKMVLKAMHQLRCKIAFMRTDVDPDEPGPFGHDGKHKVSLVDPRCVWPDPYAKTWDWKEHAFVIISRPMDLSEIKRIWPGKGHLVQADETFTYSDGQSQNQAANSQIVRNLMSSPTGHQVGKRERALVLECYLRDTRVRKIDPDYEMSGEPEDDSDAECKYVPRYPNGRLLVVCGDVLLRDSGNPYDHGEPPITAFPEGPYNKLFEAPPVSFLNILERKIDMLLRAGFDNNIVHANNQWVVDRNAFTKPEQFQNITQSPKQIFIVRPGSRIQRLPPGQLPPDYYQFVDMCGKLMDDILGITDINRGQLQKGAQLAADSVQQLQGAGLQRMKMKVSMDKESTIQLGKQFYSNLRQFYPAKMEVKAKDPTGNEMVFRWDKSEFKNVYGMKIEAGVDSPAGKVSALQQALKLLEHGVVDPQFVIEAGRLPNGPALIKRVEDRRQQLAEAGFVKQAINLGVKKPGAKNKEPII